MAQICDPGCHWLKGASVGNKPIKQEHNSYNIPKNDFYPFIKSPYSGMILIYLYSLLLI